MWGDFNTLDCAEVVRAGDLDCMRSFSTHGDSSTGLLGSLKSGRLGESPVNLSIVASLYTPEGCAKAWYSIFELGSPIARGSYRNGTSLRKGGTRGAVIL